MFSKTVPFADIVMYKHTTSNHNRLININDNTQFNSENATLL